MDQIQKDNRLLGTVANMFLDVASLNRKVTSLLDINWCPDEKAESFIEVKEQLKLMEASIGYIKDAIALYETKE